MIFNSDKDTTVGSLIDAYIIKRNQGPLTPQVVLMQYWNMVGSAIITNLSTRDKKVGNVLKEPQAFAEMEISGIKLYTTQIEINKDTDIRFILDDFVPTLLNLPWHPVSYTDNNVIERYNDIPPYAFELDAKDQEIIDRPNYACS